MKMKRAELDANWQSSIVIWQRAIGNHLALSVLKRSYVKIHR